jgi:hypothetical protein
MKKRRKEGGVMTTVTKEQVRAVFEAVRAIADLIKALGSVPSGHLYARLMEGGNISLENYLKVIDTLKRAGLVTESGNLLTWVGPKE